MKSIDVFFTQRAGSARLLSVALVYCCLNGCASGAQRDRHTPEQNFASSYNYLLGASETQSAALEPLWMTYQQSETHLMEQLPAGSEELFAALSALDQRTIAKSRDHLTPAQSARLEALFKERREEQRASVKRMREIEEELAERDRNGPETVPPDKKEGRRPSPGGGGGTGGAGGW